MALKKYSSNKAFAVRGFGICLAVILTISSCAGIPPSPAKTETATPKPAPAPAPVPAPAPAVVEQPDSRDKTPDARALASKSLTDEGARLLKDRNFDGAIRILEQAVGVNPQDGQGYYYLAEAWIGKNDFPLAARFNGLASLYLRDEKGWPDRVRAQKNRIDSR